MWYLQLLASGTPCCLRLVSVSQGQTLMVSCVPAVTAVGRPGIREALRRVQARMMEGCRDSDMPKVEGDPQKLRNEVKVIGRRMHWRFTNLLDTCTCSFYVFPPIVL